MRRAALFLVLFCSLAPEASAWCLWGCAEEEPTTSTSTTTTTTTRPLLPGQCRSCSEWSFCANRTENELCNSCVCPQGVHGDCCDQPAVDRCAHESSLCPTHADCKFDLFDGFKCVCRGEAVGPACTLDDPCTKNPCLNGADCVLNERKDDFECSCALGFAGRFCENPLLCRSDRCACRWSKCENNATCVVDPLKMLLDYTCLCPRGFTGAFCEVELPCVIRNPCEHGGVCEVDPSNAANYRCKCPSIWKGARCDQYDPCHTLALQCVHGTCVSTSESNAECSCGPGYDGALCDNDIDDCTPNPCEHAAECTDAVNNFACECPEGTKGHRCEINYDDCNTKVPRVNPCMQRDKRAECIDGINAFRCNCSAEWTGANCSTRLIIWNVLQKLDKSEFNLVGLLEDLVLKPSLITDIVPFFLALMPAENQTAISWEHEDLFEWASFEGAEVAVRQEMVKWNAATLGNCFTFNHDSSPEKRSLRYAGERQGFRALMRVRQDEYLDWIDTASLLVFVHSSKESVFGESLRFQVEPGTETSLMISQNTFKRIGGAYGVCVEDKSEVASYYYDGDYTTDGCLRSCYQDAVFSACECMDPRFPMKSDVIPCGMEKRTCVHRVTAAKGDPSNWPDCRCPLPCSNGQFNVRWSNVDLVETRNATRDQALISVHFPQMIQTNFKEEPKMDFNKFISNLGGLLGVLCGISILTFIEFAFLLFRLTFVFFFGK